MASESRAATAGRHDLPGQIVLVFQGGGALGSYQAGVYQALYEAAIEPDWIIGTSIGAINASLIAGNAPDDRLPNLTEFWRRVESHPHWATAPYADPNTIAAWSNWSVLLGGIPAFFAPNPMALWGPHLPLGADNAGYYSTAPLARTLLDLVDFERLNGGAPRITVGAARVRSSEMRYFDSRTTEIRVEHVLASGALPPAFPAVRIDGELYWDGGILSNTPSEIVFDDNPRRDSIIFAVHVWNPHGPEPQSLWDVMHRQKDIQYSSRIATHVGRQKQLHKLRHVINDLVATMPEDMRGSDAVKGLAAYGCVTRMHVVPLLSPRHDSENHTKDIDFSPNGIRRRWKAGYDQMSAVLATKPWTGDFDPLEGLIVHEPGARPALS